MKIALVTYDALPALDPDDHLLVRALEARGCTVDAAVWSDAAVAWSTYDAALLRSTWDYFHRHDEFLAWTKRADAATKLFHSAAFVAWNSDKRYLAELEAAGVPTVPTVWCRAGETVHLNKISRERGWPSLLVKPAISGGAFGTLRVSSDNAERARAQAEIDALAKTRDLLVQPYLPRVEKDGEASLFYFDGIFSHAVRKRPVEGDFRVQEQFGGIATEHQATAAEKHIADLTLAAAAKSAAKEPLLYARIDLLYDEENAPRLIELEAIEPSLFFRQAKGAEDRMADAFLRRLRA